MQISQDQQVDLTRGTRVTLHLKEDAAEMASPAKLQTLIKQYSQFIQFPIRLWNSRQETDQVLPATLVQSQALRGCVCLTSLMTAPCCCAWQQWSQGAALPMPQHACACSTLEARPPQIQLSEQLRLLLHHARALAAYVVNRVGLRLLGVQVPDEAATAKKQAEADEAAKKEGKDQAEPVEPQTKSQPREEWDWAVQNDAKPLWTRSAREVRCPCSTDLQYRVAGLQAPCIMRGCYGWSEGVMRKQRMLLGCKDACVSLFPCALQRSGAGVMPSHIGSQTWA